MWQWLSQLSAAQSTLVGSAAGFVFGVVALIIGALINFALNRRRDALIRSEEVASVLAALFSEIVLLRAEVAKVANIVARIEANNGQFDQHFLELVRLSEPAIFKTFTSKLGMLHPDLCLSITKFYANLERVRSWLPLLAENEQRKFNYSALTVLEPAIEAIDGVTETLQSISFMLKLTSPPGAPDIEKARDVREYEKLKWEQG